MRHHISCTAICLLLISCSDKPSKGLPKGTRTDPIVVKRDVKLPRRGPRPKHTGGFQMTKLLVAGAANQFDRKDFGPGEPIYAWVELRNFKAKVKYVELDLTMRIEDKQGNVYLRQSFPIRRFSASGRRKLPLLQTTLQVSLGPAVPSGEYTLHMEAVDGYQAKASTKKSVNFKWLGHPLAQSEKLAIARLEHVGQAKLPPRAILPLSYQVSGFATSASGKDFGYQLEVSGRVLGSRAKPTVDKRKGKLPFNPKTLTGRFMLPIDKSVRPGNHRLELTVRDKQSKSVQKKVIPFKVVRPKFDAYTCYLRGVDGVARKRYRPGQVVIVRCQVLGFKTRKGSRPKTRETALTMDFAVAGPGGVTNVFKTAAYARRFGSWAVANKGRWPIHHRFQLEQYAYAGKHRAVLRFHDEFANKSFIKEVPFEVYGQPIAPVAKGLKIDKLSVRKTTAPLPIKGDTFVAGERYYLNLAVGERLKPAKGKPVYEHDWVGNLKLRTTSGKEVHKSEKLFKFKAKIYHRPLRVPLQATWHIPKTVGAGLYDLDIDIVDQPRNLVSQLRRRIQIVRR